MKNYLKTLFLEKKDIFYIFKSRFLMNHKSLKINIFIFYKILLIFREIFLNFAKVTLIF